MATASLAVPKSVMNTIVGRGARAVCACGFCCAPHPAAHAASTTITQISKIVARRFAVNFTNPPTQMRNKFALDSPPERRRNRSLNCDPNHRRSLSSESTRRTDRPGFLRRDIVQAVRRARVQIGCTGDFLRLARGHRALPAIADSPLLVRGASAQWILEAAPRLALITGLLLSWPPVTACIIVFRRELFSTARPAVWRIVPAAR